VDHFALVLVELVPANERRATAQQNVPAQAVLEASQLTVAIFLSFQVFAFPFRSFAPFAQSLTRLLDLKLWKNRRLRQI
jgi:hypothetical protein